VRQTAITLNEALSKAIASKLITLDHAIAREVSVTAEPLEVFTTGHKNIEFEYKRERWIELTLKIYGPAQSTTSKYNRVVKPAIQKLIEPPSPRFLGFFLFQAKSFDNKALKKSYVLPRQTR